MNMKNITISFAALSFCLSLGVNASPRVDVDFSRFLGNHDMTWNRVPNRWEVAPFSGNGNIGFTMYS